MMSWEARCNQCPTASNNGSKALQRNHPFSLPSWQLTTTSNATVSWPPRFSNRTLPRLER